MLKGALHWVPWSCPGGTGSFPSLASVPVPTELGLERQEAKITGSISGSGTEEKTRESGKRETGDGHDSEVGLR